MHFYLTNLTDFGLVSVIKVDSIDSLAHHPPAHTNFNLQILFILKMVPLSVSLSPNKSENLMLHVKKY